MSNILNIKDKDGNWVGIPAIQGEKGEDGFSPIVQVTQREDGVNIAITDANGTTNAKVIGTVNEDYQDLVNDVDSLKSDLSQITEGGVDNLFVNSTKVIGALEPDGTISSDNTSCWTSDYIKVDKKPVRFNIPNIPSDAIIRIGIYSSAKTWNAREVIRNVGSTYTYENTNEMTYIKVSMKYGSEVGLEVYTDETDYTAIDSVARSRISNIEDDVESIKDVVYSTTDKTIEWVVGVACVGSNIMNASRDKTCKPILLRNTETVTVTTKGDGSYNFNCISFAQKDTQIVASSIATVTNVKTITSNNLTSYTYTATEDVYIVASVLNDSSSSIQFGNIVYDSIRDYAESLDRKVIGVLNHKTVMFFGDSLTAASSNSVVGFAKIIADLYGMPYASFVYDSSDGSATDVAIDYKRFTNYAKDGTTNRIVSDRNDSVIERVKSHIDADTDVDYVLIECCVNDSAGSLRNKGAISDSYTTFDTSTTIGAIEETIRYLTTLDKPIRVGFYIPWNVTWVQNGWFDDYIAVFNKWGMPYIDLRNSCGFNMLIPAHSRAYSLSSDSYSAWDSSTTYNLDDKVKYGGSCYKCTANGVVGVVPTDESKWMLVSSTSSDGTHLNSLGHKIVCGKIQNFIESL